MTGRVAAPLTYGSQNPAHIVRCGRVIFFEERRLAGVPLVAWFRPAEEAVALKAWVGWRPFLMGRLCQAPALACLEWKGGPAFASPVCRDRLGRSGAPDFCFIHAAWLRVAGFVCWGEAWWYCAPPTEAAMLLEEATARTHAGRIRGGCCAPLPPRRSWLRSGRQSEAALPFVVHRSRRLAQAPHQKRASTNPRFRRNGTFRWAQSGNQG